MATERGCYAVLTDEKKRILCEYYDKGMTTTSPCMHAFIDQAAQEANLSVDKVKKWIGNERRKRRASSTFVNDLEERQSNKPPSKRAITGYNLFCSQMMNSDECQMLSSKSAKMKFAVDKWKSLSLEKCEEWKENARELANNCTTELTPKQKKAQVLKAKKQLIAQLSYLESLGCDASVMIFEHESKEISHYGTGKGLKYLSENNEATIKFMEFFECPNEKYSASDVAAMFNRKYREASGKLCARVPYHKGGFEVTGLPDGVEFKKPTSYGANTIQAIMKNSENIKFFIVENQASDREETLQLTSKHSQALTKIVDSDKIGRILSGETSIKGRFRSC
ncbi:general transcription factor II-I repeat domain-containing protein 1-like [Dendronephthya gigantea]|uniref:general transcription factor II-I repeat domain-containing protein 1-like n=1 Tax=Dendronephthya gigantea TaxID=151771 RepID=UPI0010696928|nr:general transcription factor II-I repeat domain-containing protein 1-like [Dendronephthya gigantea]